MTVRRRGFALDGIKPYRLLPSARLGTALLMVFSTFCLNLCNFSIGFCITCMVNSTSPDNLDIADPIAFGNNTGNGSDANNTCLGKTSHEENGYRGTYRWSTLHQSFILSGVGWGGMAFIFFGGMLADRVGARPLFVVGFIVLGIASILIPVTAEWSWMGPFIMRILQGVVQFTGFPALLVMSNRWFPIPERGSLMALGLSGASLGGMFIYGVGGPFCRSAAGWEALLYLVGAINIVCSVAFLVLYRDDVDKSPFITRKEAAYIVRTRGEITRKSNQHIPWKKILTSIPVLAYILINFSQYYLYYYIQGYMPKFFKEVLGLTVESVGLWSALTLLMQFFGRIMAGPLSDGLERLVSQTMAIRIMTLISGHLAAIMLMCVTAFGCDSAAGAIGCIVTSYFLFGFVIGGFLKSASYIAPPYAGTIAGLAQELNYISNTVMPYITAAMMPTGSPEEWNKTLYLTGGICAIGATVFIIFGSGELQPWAKQDKDNLRSSIISGSYDFGKRKSLTLIPRPSVYSEVAFP